MAVVKVKNPKKKVDLPVPVDVVIDTTAESDPESVSESAESVVAPVPTPTVKAKKASVPKIKAEKEPKAKRAPSAYNKFVSAKIHEIRAQKPGLAPTEYMKLVGGLWKTASDEEKKKFAA